MTEKDIEDQEPNAFQKRVSDLFYELFYDKDQLLSLSWTRHLLQSFLRCQEDFLLAVRSHRSEASAPSVDRLSADFRDRSVKVLDACNAAISGIERLKRRRDLVEIVRVALAGPRRQLRRAKRALSELAEEREETRPVLTWHRHSRSHSWGGVATKQPPVDGGGMAAALALMTWLMGFVGWALAALAGHHVSFHVASPRGVPWAALLQERLAAEAKRRRGSSGGILNESQRINTCVIRLAELAELDQCHLAERENEMAEFVAELAEVNDSTRDELEPLERLVRQTFHGIVRTREETLI